MPVSSQHEDYIEALEKWELVNDCDEGTQTIKRKTTDYLPMPNSSDKSKENKARYKAYIERALFTNFTGHTKDGLLGLVFRKKTVFELPPELEYMRDNANGDGLTADQMVKDISGETLKLGRDGLLTDYPQAESGLTEQQVSDLNLRSSIKQYQAKSIINWRYTTIGGVSLLSQVVLVESAEKAIDEFSYESVTNYRVLSLKDINGRMVYVQNVYNEKEELISDDIVPRKNDGSTWDNIPFTFVGSNNNDSKVDKAPLYDISNINISHYRNSADYEDSSFLVGQPTPVLAGLTPNWVSEVLKNDVSLGSRGAIPLPVGGSASLLQANENQMPLKGMEIKEAQLLKIGASLITDSGSGESEETVRIRFIGQNSKLGSIIQNVESAFTQCLKWAQEFQGGNGDIVVLINKEFYPKTMSPQTLIAQIQLLDRGVIAKSDLRHSLRDADLIDTDRTDEEIDGEAEINVIGGM